MVKPDMEVQRRRLVVIGRGVAGSLLAKSLQFHIDVTLIDLNEYFEILWENLRAMVEPSFAERLVINHRDYFTNGHIVTSIAIDTIETQILIAQRHLIPYDFLGVATGHANCVPKSRTDRLDQYKGGETI